jgi:anti-sigma factor RsiW
VNANSTHLDLEDLIAEVTGQAIGDQAREHLAGCEQCQLEANRWNLVADGVRDLAAEAAEVPEPARPPRTGRHRLAGPWRRAMLTVGSAAAALVLLIVIGIAAGVVHVHLSGSGPGSQTTLTSVSGCTRLEQANGTLERVNGAGVVIKTASGRLVTVSTKATTRLMASGALLGDITDGATVTVAGTTSDGTMAADYVVVSTNPPSLAVPGIVTVRGTVSDAGAAGFTVVTPAGTRVPVTTSGTKAVTVSHARLSQLQDGARTTAVGYVGPGGTLSALIVAQPPGWPAGAHSSVSVKNCSSTAINHEIMALGYGG